MPLSEDEQRILRQIEEQLQRDPSFGRDIKPRRVGSRRAVVVSSICTVVCLVLTILLLGVSPYLSFVAFVGAVAALVIAERHVAALGEAGLNHLSDSVRSRLGGSGNNRDN
ncbi:MAG TPA: DUF3040 domain-containing protein [Ilumatobacteraceae bacterium]|jgi:hypothetical protein|nr:DUF3040 domain-containing protein [Ilumatobacteraceae bacterium]